MILVTMFSVYSPLGAQQRPTRPWVGDEFSVVVLRGQLGPGIVTSLGLVALDGDNSLGPGPARATAERSSVSRRIEAMSSRGHRAAVGSLVGLAVGGLVGLAAASEFCSGSSSCSAKQYTVGFFLGGIPGAGIGALIGAVSGNP
jgi:hypothetical protein